MATIKIKFCASSVVSDEGILVYRVICNSFIGNNIVSNNNISYICTE